MMCCQALTVNNPFSNLAAVCRMITAERLAGAHWGTRMVVAAGILIAALLLPRLYLLHRSSFPLWPSGRPVVNFVKLWLSGTSDACFVVGLLAATAAVFFLLRA